MDVSQDVDPQNGMSDEIKPKALPDLLMTSSRFSDPGYLKARESAYTHIPQETKRLKDIGQISVCQKFRHSRLTNWEFGQHFTWMT